jgi:hypothetical protein
MSEERERNSSRHDPLPSVDNIAEIAENETEENAILIAQTEISCLDDLYKETYWRTSPTRNTE